MAKSEAKAAEHDCHASCTDDQQNPNRTPGQAEAAIKALAADKAAADKAAAGGEGEGKDE